MTRTNYVRWAWNFLADLPAHLSQLVFGCRHPKLEATGADHVDVAPGVSIAVFYSTCTVCGTTIVSTD